MLKILLAGYCLCLAPVLLSQTGQPPLVQNLVFEGSGIRGIAYCGSLQELESRGLMPQVTRAGGTSAGAIMALAVSLGYTSAEIRELIGQTNFRRFNDGRYFFAGGIFRTNRYYGWYRGNRFENWLEKLIEQKTGNADITFSQLHAQGYRELYITGTCLNKQQLVVFSHITYPDMKVKDAVRISMSIPLYFEAVFIDEKGKIVPHPKKKQGLDIMVDGGLTGNFPIRIFDTAAWRNPSTLGFRIDTDEQISNDLAGRQLAARPVNRLGEYVTALYTIVIENLNRQLLEPADWQRTVSISDGDIGPRIRKLSRDEINVLVENGRRAVEQYLK